MNEYAKKLVAALRSGEYKQGRRTLHDGGAYCCLGVACDLVKDELCASWEQGSEDEEFLFLGEKLRLPEEVRKLYGFSTIGGNYGESAHESLTYLNDNGKTFAELADFIESEPGELFE